MRVLKVAEVAQKLEISPGLVYALCAGRKLRHTRIGMGRGCIRIPEDAIQEFLNSCTVGVKPQVEAFSSSVPMSIMMRSTRCCNLIWMAENFFGRNIR